MPKIYNEIIIDMNPQSSSFEKVIYEDSFDYIGDMMLMQGVEIKEGTQIAVTAEEYQGSKGYHYMKWKNGEWVLTKTSYIGTPTIPIYASKEEATKGLSGTSVEWGAGAISKDDFVDPATGEPRRLHEVVKILDPKLPGLTGQALIDNINKMAPQYVGVKEEEKTFAKEAREADVYGLQKKARKLGPAAGGVGMRGKMTGQKDIAKGFERSQQKYEEDIYGLEKKATTEYETEVADWIKTDWLEEPDTGAKITEDWSKKGFEFRGGGKVPNKEETFLDILSQLPDAGGS